MTAIRNALEAAENSGYAEATSAWQAAVKEYFLHMPLPVSGDHLARSRQQNIAQLRALHHDLERRTAIAQRNSPK